MLFLLATFFTPLVSAIPSEAAAPALVLVGFLMMQQVTEIDWRDLEVAIPAFLTIVLMPFTYSISVGIGAGFVAYVLHQGRASASSATCTRSCGSSPRCSSSTSPTRPSAAGSADRALLRLGTRPTSIGIVSMGNELC